VFHSQTTVWRTSYEYFASQPQKALSDVQRFVGVQYVDDLLRGAKHHSPLFYDTPLSKLVTNYAEVVRELNGTQFASFLAAPAPTVLPPPPPSPSLSRYLHRHHISLFGPPKPRAPPPTDLNQPPSPPPPPPSPPPPPPFDECDYYDCVDERKAHR
jgi:hypothetical protein